MTYTNWLKTFEGTPNRTENWVWRKMTCNDADVNDQRPFLLSEEEDYADFVLLMTKVVEKKYIYEPLLDADSGVSTTRKT